MKFLAKNHPLRKARWIWPIEDPQYRNAYAQFRRNFTLEAPPRSTPFYVTADQAYQLWVNGQYVGRGPARGYQTTWAVDKYNLTPYLKVGKNWISILAHNPGRGTFSYVQAAGAGMICAGKVGKTDLATPDGWQMRQDPARATNTSIMTTQLGLQESFDANLDDEVWIYRAGRPRGNGWEKPVSSHPYGFMPWHELTERGVPNLTAEVMPYRAIHDLGETPMLEDWEQFDNIAIPGLREVPNATWGLKPPSVKKYGDYLQFRLKPAAPGRATAVVLDLGKMQVGTPIFEVLGAAGGETLDIHFFERYDSDGQMALVRAKGDRFGMAARLTLRKGKTSHELFPIIGYRFAVIIVRGASKPLTFRVSLRKTVYPLKVTGTFNCSDRELNDIHALCRHTQEICMLDAYVDTPNREQAQWWGDARVQSLNTFFLSGDTRLLQRGIEQIGGQRVPNGLTYGHAPTISHGCVLPDFTLIWILTFWDEYRQSGQFDMLKTHRTSIDAALAYFADEGRNRTGLLRYDERYWLFLDWADIYKGQTPSLLNFWYLIVLQKLVIMAEAAGLDAWADELKHLRNRQEKLIVQKLWDPAERMFCDGLDDDGQQVKTYSIHVQTLAIMAGLKKRLWWRMIQERLLPYLQDKRVASPEPSSYWVHYVYDVMSRIGYGAEVLEHIKRHWTPMVPFGGCWETFQTGPHGWGTNSHAWSAHPLVHLMRILGGVWQETAGWTRIRFEPIFAGRTRARVAVPTPQGVVRANWNLRDGVYHVNLKLPGVVRADVKLPGVEVTDLAEGGSWDIPAKG